jgi:hypothetical protein
VLGFDPVVGISVDVRRRASERSLARPYGRVVARVPPDRDARSRQREPEGGEGRSQAAPRQEDCWRRHRSTVP